MGNIHPTVMLPCYDLWLSCPPGSATDRVSGVENLPKDGEGESACRAEGGWADPSPEPENLAVRILLECSLVESLLRKIT